MIWLGIRRSSRKGAGAGKSIPGGARKLQSRAGTGRQCTAPGKGGALLGPGKLGGKQPVAAPHLDPRHDQEEDFVAAPVIREHSGAHKEMPVVLDEKAGTAIDNPPPELTVHVTACLARRERAQRLQCFQEGLPVRRQHTRCRTGFTDLDSAGGSGERDEGPIIGGSAGDLDAGAARIDSVAIGPMAAVGARGLTVGKVSARREGEL
jgi:hypothetical protein